MLNNSTLDKLVELLEVQSALFEKSFPESNELDTFSDVIHELEEEINNIKNSQPVDNVTGAVISKLSARSHKGLREYGKSMDRNDLTLIEWLQHHHEELLDSAVYVQKMINILLMDGSSKPKTGEN